MEKKFSYQDYCHARNLEEIANLCWNLSGMLSEHFVGYENELRILHDLAIEFDKQFKEFTGYEDGLPF